MHSTSKSWRSGSISDNTSYVSGNEVSCSPQDLDSPGTKSSESLRPQDRPPYSRKTSLQKASEISLSNTPTIDPSVEKDTHNIPLPSITDCHPESVPTRSLSSPKQAISATGVQTKTQTIRITSSGLNAKNDLKRTFEQEKGDSAGYDVSTVCE